MKYFKIFVTLVFVLSFWGCAKKETFNNTDTKVGSSRVTFFVDLQLEGSDVISIVQGSPFTDPGATATENGQPVPITVDGAVNINQSGLYTLSYSAKNVDGFAKSVSRVVIVVPGNEIPGTDLSGNYTQVGAENNTTVTKIGPGAYFMANMNHPLSPIGAYFISLNGLDITWPAQPTPFGEMTGSGTYNPATKKAVWSISIPSASYNRTRTFQRL